MEAILKDVNAVVGVTGSFVCDEEGQIIAKLLPNVFDEAVLSPVARTMAQTIAGLRIARRRKVGDIDLLYDQGRLIIKSIGAGCLCILCVTHINVPLLNLTANVAVKKLEQELKAPKPQAMPQKPKPATKPQVESQPEPQAEPEPPAEMEMEAEIEEMEVEGEGEGEEEEPARRMTLAELMAANIRR